MQKKLTELQPFNAMVKLFKKYYDLDSSGDIAVIAGSMNFLQDKKTVDEAKWEIWTECLDVNLKHKKLKNYNYVTVLQAFLAIGHFLEGFFGTTGIASDIIFIQQNMQLARD